MARFYLGRATFALYVVPPERWDGYAGLSGSGSRNHRLDHVAFGYFDEPIGARRGFEVVNQHPHRPHPEPPIGPEDVGTWRTRPLGGDTASNFIGRFMSREEESTLDALGPDRFGPTRVTAAATLEAGGWEVEVIRREYQRFPSLRKLQMWLPRVRVTLQGWELSFDELEAFARDMRRLEAESELFRALEAAQARRDRRFEELRGRDPRSS